MTYVALIAEREGRVSRHLFETSTKRAYLIYTKTSLFQVSKRAEKGYQTQKPEDIQCLS